MGCGVGWGWGVRERRGIGGRKNAVFFLHAVKQDGYIGAKGLKEGGGIMTSQMVSAKAANTGYICSSDVTFPGNCVVSKGDENA